MSVNDYPSYFDLLERSKLVSGLSTEDLKVVCAEANPWVQSFKKGARIWSQGDYVPFIDILEKGVIISQKHHIDGGIQLICAFTPPEVVNLETPASNKKTSPVLLTARTDCSVLRINYENLVKNKSIPERIRLRISLNIAAYLSDDCIRFMYKSDVLSRRKVRDRVLAFLSIMKHQTGRNSFDIGMSQDEFSQYLCVDRTSLSEALNDLRRENIIDFKKAKFILKDPDFE